MRSRRRTLLFTGLAAIGLGALALALRPDPIPVDLAIAKRGPLQVTVDEDGETRAHDRYLLSAPVAGRISRIELHEGDAVAAGEVIAVVSPLPLSAREREEQLARITAAEALQRQSEERVRHAEEERAQALRERQRMERLLAQGVVSTHDAEQARLAEVTSGHELEAARFQARSAAAELDATRAALLAIEASPAEGTATVPIRSPAAGRVLHIDERNERVVAPGTPIITVADPGLLEVVIDVLSSEAVKIRPGMTVVLTGRGDDQTMLARVRTVEPHAFTKVSALGVEEQRVNVVADLLDPPGPLGDGYRLDAQVVVWSGEDILKVPASAVFRRGSGWAVFVVSEGRAHRRDVEIGHRGALEVEILKGVGPGDALIRHPSNDIDDGVRVQARDAG